MEKVVEGVGKLPIAGEFVTGDYIITPKIAELWLEQMNVSNRPLRQSTVDKYAEAMRSGKWLLNGESLIISKTGRIMSGQHRLWACVISGCEFPTHLVFVENEEAFHTLDQGGSRSLGDVLVVAGMVPGTNKKSNGLVLAATVNILIGHSDGWRTEGKPTREQAIHYLEACPGVVTSVEWAMEIGFYKPIPSSLAAALHYLGSVRARQPERTESFLMRLKSGLFTGPGDQAYMLNRRLRGDEKLNKREMVALAMKALKKNLDGIVIKNLSWRPGEGLPKF